MNETLQLVRAEGEPRQRIQVAARVSMNSLIESADIFQIVRRELSNGRDQIQAMFLDFFQEYIALISDAVRRGIEQGAFRPVNPNEAARVLLTMLQGSFAMAYLGGQRPQLPEKAADTLLEIYFQGIDAH